MIYGNKDTCQLAAMAGKRITHIRNGDWKGKRVLLVNLDGKPIPAHEARALLIGLLEKR